MDTYLSGRKEDKKIRENHKLIFSNITKVLFSNSPKFYFFLLSLTIINYTFIKIRHYILPIFYPLILPNMMLGIWSWLLFLHMGYIVDSETLLHLRNIEVFSC